MYEEIAICGLPLYFVVVWLKWLVTRSVRDIYETAKSKEEIEQRLCGLVEYMKWKSEETLAAYQHYFDEQRDTDARAVFQQRMHEEIQRYQEEREQGKRKQPTPRKSNSQETSADLQEVSRFTNEPDLSFLYSLAREG